MRTADYHSDIMTAERSELLDDPTNGLSDDDTTSAGSTRSRTCCGRHCELECFDWSMPKRYVIVILLFVGMIVVNAQRVNIGVTVVTILDQVHSGGEHHARSGSEGMTELSSLGWSPSMVGLLHSIFYIGLLISQVPCGYIVTKFPSHRLFGLCCLITCGLNFLLPVSIIRIGFGMTCTVRLLQGLVEGLLYPSCYDVLRQWTLPEERSRMGASVLTGSYIGPTIGMILSGLLTYYLGWAYVFFVHGAAGVIWYIFWVFMAYEKPAIHPSISLDEQKMMEWKQGETAVVYQHDKVPWVAMFTSMPVYSLIVCNFARSFVFYMLLTNQPTYLNIFHLSIAENGLFSSLPHAFMALFCVVSGTVADYLMAGPWLSATVIRKLFTCLGFGIEAAFFFALALTSDRSVAVSFLTLGVGISGIAISGWQINHLDLAPRYAGILVAITMTFGTLAGVFNPIIVAAMTTDQSLSSWHNVFWMTGGVLTVATIFYAVFGSGELQSWAIPKPPTQRVVSKIDALAGRKPYGTFHAQLDDPLSNPNAFQMNGREKGEMEESEKDVDESVTSKTTNLNFNTASENCSSMGDDFDYSTAGTNEYNSSDDTSCTSEVPNTLDVGISRRRPSVTGHSEKPSS